MEFKLDRDLCFLDIEATGLHVIRDRIIQIAIIKYFADSREYQELSKLINPGMPISEEAMEITGITPDIVRNKPTFTQVAPEIFEFIGDADIAGYNSNRFDIPMLLEEFNRAGLDFHLEARRTIDVQRIFNRMEPRNLRAAYRFYCDKDLQNAHDALEDVRATVDILKGQLRKYEGQDLINDDGVLKNPVVNDMQSLHEFTNDQRMLDVTQKLKYNKKGEIIFNFGRYLGRPVIQTLQEDKDYYHWILKKEFSVQVKNIVKRLVEENSAEEKNQ